MIVISFDTDHMTDHMMSVFLAEVMPEGLPATFFCYKPFQSLSQTPYELALHPFLGGSDDWPRTIDNLRSAIKNVNGISAQGFRPHSLTCSQNLLVQAHEMAFNYVSSVHTPVEWDFPCFRHVWGPVEIPIRYMDNMDIWARDKAERAHDCFSKHIIEMAIRSEHVFCFDFHPVHIYLNTSRFSDYEEWVLAGRKEIGRPVVRKAYGTRDFFIDLCDAAVRADARLGTCFDAAQLCK